MHRLLIIISLVYMILSAYGMVRELLSHTKPIDYMRNKIVTCSRCLSFWLAIIVQLSVFGFNDIFLVIIYAGCVSLFFACVTYFTEIL